MASSDIFTLGLGLSAPWRVIDQRLETDKQPNELHLAIAAEPGARFPCPTCGRLCKPHDWKELSWRHLNWSVRFNIRRGQGASLEKGQ
jgi:hypothetical protein